MKQQINFKEFYEEYGKEWVSAERKEYEILSSKWKADNVLTLLNKHPEIKTDLILDYGCGPAYFLNNLASIKEIKMVYCCDLSESMIKSARVNFPKGKFSVEKDLSSFSKKVDIVLFMDVLEHVPNPEEILNQSKLISDYQFIKIPLENALVPNLLRTLNSNKINAEGHIQSWKQKTFIRLLEKNNFEVVDYWRGNPKRELHYYNKDRQKISIFRKIIRAIDKFIFNFKGFYAYIYGSNLFVITRVNGKHHQN